MITNKLQDLGTIKQGDRVEVVFTNASGFNDIYRIRESCGCTKATIMGNGDIRVIFKAESIPNHLRSQGYYEPQKHIIVQYKSGMQDILTIKAKVTL